MLKFLQGKKAYICALLIGVFAALDFLGVKVSEEIKQLILGLLGAGAIASMRAAITKTTPVK